MRISNKQAQVALGKAMKERHRNDGPNAIRLKTEGADANGITVRSSIDQSYKLCSREDEQIQFGRDDLVIIKNCSDRPARLRLKHTCGNELIVRSSRRGGFKLYPEKNSVHKSDVVFEIAGGEVYTVRDIEARNPTGNGSQVTA